MLLRPLAAAGQCGIIAAGGISGGGISGGGISGISGGGISGISGGGISGGGISGISGGGISGGGMSGGGGGGGGGMSGASFSPSAGGARGSSSDVLARLAAADVQALFFACVRLCADFGGAGPWEDVAAGLWAARPAECAGAGRELVWALKHAARYGG
jgi:hypothetical protein